MDTEDPTSDLSDSSKVSKEDLPEVDTDSEEDIEDTPDEDDAAESLKKVTTKVEENVGDSNINSDTTKVKDSKIESDVKPSQESEGSSKGEEPKSTISSSEYDPKNVHYEGDLAIYTDPKSGYQYKWCKETNEWLPKGGVTYGFEDDVHTYTDTDGVKYFWDVDKNAWFPKIDDDFMARYQMSYGFIDNISVPDVPAKKAKKMEENEDEDDEEEDDDEEDEEKLKKKPVKGKGLKQKGEVTPATWFEINEQQNTKVYVSNLPTDITEEEFVDLMQKCGLVMRDLQTGKMKIKLYTVPETDILKGDALCTYIKIESVELALNLLDGYTFKGKQIKVERAKFEMKGTYDPTKKPKKKRRKDKDKLKKMQEKLFDWRPEKMRGERSKHERVVIIKNLFEPVLFDTEVSLILEYQDDLREECGKFGTVKRVVLYDRHPEGVAQITMQAPEEADEVVNLLNGRWFCKRQLSAEIWDGKTKYKIQETDSQISQRLEKWDKFLVEGEGDEANQEKKTTEDPKAPDKEKVSTDETALSTEKKEKTAMEVVETENLEQDKGVILE